MEKALKVRSEKITHIDDKHVLVELWVADSENEAEATISLWIRLPIETWLAEPQERIRLDALLETFRRLDPVREGTLKAIMNLRGRT